MDLEGIMLNEVSQVEKEKYHMISCLCRILKVKQTSEYSKKDTNKQIKKKKNSGSQWGEGRCEE